MESQIKQNQKIVFKQDHTCSICLGVFYFPVQLASCKHIFCQHCIEDFVILTTDLRCPLCRNLYNPQHAIKLTNFWNELQALYPQAIQEKKKIIKTKKLLNLKIGNTTQNLPENQFNKYKWKLFVKTAQDQKPLNEFAKKVEIKLHQTFHPNKIIFEQNQINKVQVQRIGWGTFRIQIKIFWKNKFQEQSTEFFHDLNFKSFTEKKVGCYLHEKKSSSQ